MSERNSTWRSTSSRAFVDEILQKYNCHTSTDNFFSRMSSQTLAEHIAALKGHVFSNTNSQSGNCDQTNCDEGSKIDLSNNTPPLRLCMLTNADSKYNQSGLKVDLSNSTKTSVHGKHAERGNRVSSTKNTGEVFVSGADTFSNSSSNLALTGSGHPWSYDESEVDITALTCSDSQNDNKESLCSEDSKRRSYNPIVVITPAMADGALVECADLTNNTNGELSAAMLKDSSDTCSLSSVGSCSENEILTDDEPSDDEIKQPAEDKTEKVRVDCIECVTELYSCCSSLFMSFARFFVLKQPQIAMRLLWKLSAGQISSRAFIWY